ncbi:cis-prenyltransferase [Handroanthus impetiginosus]|uniref:Alkyl transferase n=1 Tax=Handroanthus impetiginosus TaxID=429701 RepID=A0A2G9HTC5_9LAMI|nr:cis-prenyltransferase [Handroanthus impetiginosus]
MLSLQHLRIAATNNIRFANKPLMSHGASKHWAQQSRIRHGPTGSINPNFCPSKLSLADSSKKKLSLAGVSQCADQIELPKELKPELMPKHVAVIMDGNRRWAKSRGLPVQLGYTAGGQAMKQLALNCKKFGVQVVTVFAFSSENWVRPKEEVDFLMNVFEDVLKPDLKELILQKDMRLSVVGNRSQLPESLQNLLSSSEELAKSKRGMRLILALNYSGRKDITQATKNIAAKVRNGVLQVEDINESLFEQHLQTNGIDFPNPDLLIRTSGELRLSNFMLWQLAYTELLFFDKMFPDFDEADLVEGLTAFQRRQRRFGGHKY